jgi:hypothetical protein
MKRCFAALLLALPVVVTMAPSVAGTIHTIRHTLSEYTSSLRNTQPGRVQPGYDVNGNRIVAPRP